MEGVVIHVDILHAKPHELPYSKPSVQAEQEEHVVNGAAMLAGVGQQAGALIRVQKLVSGTDRFVTLPSQSLHNGGEPPLNLIEKRDQDWLDDAIQEANADVVILDTLSSLTSGWDENDNSSPGLARLKEWLFTLRHKGKSVVIFHHSGHGNKHSRGASRLEGFVDTVIKLDRQNLDQGQFVVTFPGLRGEPPKPSSLAVGLTDHGEFW